LDPLLQIRLVTLVFDRLNQDGRNLSRQAALDLVKNDHAPNIYYGVFSVDQRLVVLQQYTADRDRLKKAIEKATTGTPSQFHDESEAIEANLRTLGQSSSPEELQFAQMTLNILQSVQTMERLQQGRSSISSLLSIVKEQMRLPGRKTVLYFSDGLQVPSGLVEQFHSMIGVANRANVSVYAIDARGLLTSRDTTTGSLMLADVARQNRTQTTQSGAISFEQSKTFDRAADSMRANTQNSLAELAESTGGFLIANSNDLRAPLRRLSEDIQTYYEISYVPTIEKYDGSFRKVAVKLGRPDLKVQTRSGYFALPLLEGQTLLPYEMPMLTALNAAPLPRLIPYRAAALHFHSKENQVQSDFVIDVPLDQITFIRDEPTKSYHTHFSVLVLLKDTQGRIVHKFSQDIPYQGPIDKIDAAKVGHFIYAQHAKTAPGRYTLETAVLDREGDKVSARKSVYVAPPASTGIALSSVSLVRRMESESSAADPEDPFSFQGGKITPMLSDVVAGGPGSKLSLFFVVYPRAAAPEFPELSIEFLHDGELVGRAAPELSLPDAQGRIPYVATSPLDQFKAGQYEVHVTVKQGAATAQEHAFFTLP
jgi:VWFA-related protein